MPFDGSGNFNRVMNWVSDALANIKIVATRHDSEDDNFAAGLSNCITKDGQTQPTANIPMNAKKIINLATPTVATDAATKGYADGLITPLVTGPGVAVTDDIVTFNGTTGKIVKDSGILVTSLAPKASPALTGTPTAPTPAANDNSTKIATTAYVDAANVGQVTGPGSAVADNVATFNGATGKIIKDSGVALSSKANLASPALTGTPTAPTAAVGTNTTQLATTAFVQAATAFKTMFESAQQTYTLGGLLTLPHGLGVKPKLYGLFMQCTTADNGWAIGDEVPLYLSSGAGNKGMAVWPDATNMNVRIGSTAVDYIGKASGSGFVVTPGSWKLVVRAWA